MRSVWLFLVFLAGCAEEPLSLHPDQAWVAVVGNEAIPVRKAPPPSTPQITLPRLISGDSATLSVSGALPGERVIAVQGHNGLGAGPCIAGLAGLCLDVVGPIRRAGSTNADLAGEGAIAVVIPMFPGVELCFQPVVKRGLDGIDSVAGEAKCAIVEEPDPCDANMLIGDSSTDLVYEVDETGALLATYPSPVSGVQGVAHDCRDGQGFWVVGTGHAESIFKVDFDTGALVDTVEMDVTNREDLRGLDHWVAAFGIEGDMLVTIGVNTGSIDVVWGIGRLSGDRWIESSHFDGVFLDGFWGIDVEAAPSDLNRWTTWDDNTLQFWEGASDPISSVAMPTTDPRGVTRDADGTFWVVDHATATIFHLDEDGTTIGSFPAPGPAPTGISVP